MMSCWLNHYWTKEVNSLTRKRDMIFILQIQLQMNLEITLLASSLWIYLTWFLMIQVTTWPSISILKMIMKIQTQVSFSVTFDTFYKKIYTIMKAFGDLHMGLFHLRSRRRGNRNICNALQTTETSFHFKMDVQVYMFELFLLLFYNLISLHSVIVSWN